MIAGTIWKNLITTLEDNPALNKYVKNVYHGIRDSLEPDALPCLMLEPVQNGNTERRIDNVDYQYFHVDVYGFSTNDYHGFKNVIVGDLDYKGILDVENDVRACLKSSNTLGDTVTDILTDPAVFDQLDVGKYPARGFLMPIRILYRQQNGV